MVFWGMSFSLRHGIIPIRTKTLTRIMLIFYKKIKYFLKLFISGGYLFPWVWQTAFTMAAENKPISRLDLIFPV